MPLTHFEEAGPPLGPLTAATGDGDPTIDRVMRFKMAAQISDVITCLVKCSLEVDGFI